MWVWMEVRLLWWVGDRLCERLRLLNSVGFVDMILVGVVLL